MAWITRAPSSTEKVGASIAITVPARNRPIATVNTCRTDSRFMRKPVVGMTTAIVSMKPVESHCAVTAVMDRSAISVGSATDSRVSLRIITKAETTRTAMIGATFTVVGARPSMTVVRGSSAPSRVAISASAEEEPPATMPGVRERGVLRWGWGCSWSWERCGAFFLEGPDGRNPEPSAGQRRGQVTIRWWPTDTIRDRGDPFTQAPFRHGDM